MAVTCRAGSAERCQAVAQPQHLPSLACVPACTCAVQHVGCAPQAASLAAHQASDQVLQTLLDAVAGVQVDEVKNIMVDNIEKVLERGERIELLVDKTDNLRFQVLGAFLLLLSLCG